MKPDEERKAELRGLIADLQADRESVSRLLHVLHTRDIGTLAESTDEMVILGVGATLHHIYTGIESLFTRIAQTLDGHVPEGDDWHRRLLIRMREPIEGVRPAVVSSEVFATLDELRRFRHLFRHAYAAEYDVPRRQELVRKTLAMFPAFECDLEARLSFIRSLVAADLS